MTLKGMTVSIGVAVLAGCAGVNGTRPQDMTVPEHEEAARAELGKSQEAAEAARQGGRTAAYERVAADRHRRLADDHAAAGEWRRAHAGEPCAVPGRGVRDLAVAGVEPIVESDVPADLRNSRGYYPVRLRGARLALRTDDGDRRDTAAEVISCEAARAAAGAAPLDPASPVTVPGASVAVRSEEAGLVVEIRSRDDAKASEILRRALALAEPR